MKKSLKREPTLQEALRLIQDEADHALGTEAEKPLDVCRQNLRIIRKLSKIALRHYAAFVDPGVTFIHPR